MSTSAPIEIKVAVIVFEIGFFAEFLPNNLWIFKGLFQEKIYCHPYLQCSVYCTNTLGVHTWYTPTTNWQMENKLLPHLLDQSLIPTMILSWTAKNIATARRKIAAKLLSSALFCLGRGQVLILT